MNITSKLGRRKLSDKLKTAIKAYYDHRNKCYIDCDEYEQTKQDLPVPYKRTWDKEADLNAIYAAAVKQGLGFTASAGTFWFYWPDGTRTRHDESNWRRCKRDK
jgi:hypothetical protein